MNMAIVPGLGDRIPRAHIVAYTYGGGMGGIGKEKEEEDWKRWAGGERRGGEGNKYTLLFRWKE